MAPRFGSTRITPVGIPVDGSLLIVASRRTRVRVASLRNPRGIALILRSLISGVQVRGKFLAHGVRVLVFVCVRWLMRWGFLKRKSYYIQ